MKRVKLIYNPFSGGGKILRELDKIQEVYQNNGYLLDFFRISYESKYEQILHNISEYDHLLISGGDGTINQIINILKVNSIEIPIGILPLGTSNDFAKNLNLPKETKKACLQIINSSPMNLDLGIINERHFINIASLGLFTNVSQGTDFNLKKVLGKYAYYIKGIQEFSTLQSYNVEIEGENYFYSGEVYAILIFNGQTAGNINLAYKASLTDGKLDVLILKPNSLFQIVEILQKIKRKAHLDEKIEGLDYIQTSWLKINGKNNIQTDLDGELGPELPIEIKCQGNSLPILGLL
jgi:YegS/Rv2252/BmrU family lipid kinase